jgi:hypothetical protein
MLAACSEPVAFSVLERDYRSRIVRARATIRCLFCSPTISDKKFSDKKFSDKFFSRKHGQLSAQKLQTEMYMTVKVKHKLNM